MTEECKHKNTRWLWLEPKDARDAMEEHNPEGLELKDYFDDNNIIICSDCGAEVTP